MPQLFFSITASVHVLNKSAPHSSAKLASIIDSLTHPSAYILTDFQRTRDSLSFPCYHRRHRARQHHHHLLPPLPPSRSRKESLNVTTMPTWRKFCAISLSISCFHQCYALFFGNFQDLQDKAINRGNRRELQRNSIARQLVCIFSMFFYIPIMVIFSFLKIAGEDVKSLKMKIGG